MYHSRGLNKHQDPYTIQDIYKEYVKGFEEESPYCIKYSKYRDIVTDYLKYKMKEIFRGGMFIFPYSLGNLSITKKKPKKFKSKHLQIDWASTNELGRVVHHMNDHSDYYKFKFFWTKKNTRCLNKGCYSLTMTRENKRHLASTILGGFTDYFEH